MSAVYPPPPWLLRGVSVQSVRMIATRQARAFVPANVRIVPVLPGRTIAVVYCARYGEGSSLAYSELAVSPALIEAQGKLGFWISHIYVDSERSMAGGRDIWSLPKQPADFSWSADDCAVEVTADSALLCRIQSQPPAGRIRTPLIAPAIVRQDARFRAFWLKGRCRLARCRGEISAHARSPVAQLGFSAARAVFVARELSLEVSAPSRRGARAPWRS